LVEGDTEHAALPEFLKRWLDPKLGQRVGIRAVNLGGNGEYVKGVARMAAKQLNDPKRQEIIAVIGLLDLYGLPKGFFSPNLSDAQDRYSWAKQELERRVGQAKFRQFFAVHDVEVWLLSDPDNKYFPQQIKNALRRVTANPESVNFDQPPAELLIKLYREKLKNREYRKVPDGCDLFRELDPEIAYRKCPRLKEMLDEMLKLAKENGN
jgi:Domain of unknown function (DUF4276)